MDAGRLHLGTLRRLESHSEPYEKLTFPSVSHPESLPLFSGGVEEEAEGEGGRGGVRGAGPAVPPPPLRCAEPVVTQLPRLGRPRRGPPAAEPGSPAPGSPAIVELAAAEGLGGRLVGTLRWLGALPVLVTLGRSVFPSAPGVPRWGCSRRLKKATRMPPCRGRGGRRSLAELERGQGTAGKQVSSVSGGWAHAGKGSLRAPGCAGFSPTDPRLPAPSQVRSRDATSLTASGAEPLPHHVIACEAGVPRCGHSGGLSCRALPGSQTCLARCELWAAPGAPNFEQDGELGAPCSEGMGDPVGCACVRVCAGSSLTPDKKASGGVSIAILNC